MITSQFLIQYLLHTFNFFTCSSAADISIVDFFSLIFFSLGVSSDARYRLFSIM